MKHFFDKIARFYEKSPLSGAMAGVSTSIRQTAGEQKAKKKRRLFSDALTLVFASLLYAAAFRMFILPAGVIPGGVSGIAALLYRFFPFLPIGVYVLLLNLPLFFFAFRVFGGRYIFRTLVGTLLTGAALSLPDFFPKISADPLFLSLFGGLALGASLGLFYGRFYNTGGADIAVAIASEYRPGLSKGKITLMIDAVVIGVSALILKSAGTVFYSVVALYAESRMIDLVTLGYEKGQLVFIFTQKQNEIARRITGELGRGVTLLPCTGYMRRLKGEAILCALRDREAPRLRAIVKEIDAQAFTVYTNASMIDGLGFERKPP